MAVLIYIICLPTKCVIVYIYMYMPCSYIHNIYCVYVCVLCVYCVCVFACPSIAHACLLAWYSSCWFYKIWNLFCFNLRCYIIISVQSRVMNLTFTCITGTFTHTLCSTCTYGADIIVVVYENFSTILHLVLVVIVTLFLSLHVA